MDEIATNRSEVFFFKEIGMETFAWGSTIDNLEAILCVVIDIHTSSHS
jgi:hypothetical protein